MSDKYNRLLSYLEQIDGVGKQKEILFTQVGELLMADARLLLAGLDQTLNDQLGPQAIQSTVTSLAKIRAVMAQLADI